MHWTKKSDPSVDAYSPAALEKRLSKDNLPDQFIICRDRRHVPETWPVIRIGDWHVGRFPTLPVVTIVDAAGAPAGVMLGYVIDRHGEPLTSGACALPPSGSGEYGPIEDWIYGHGGRFIVALLTNRRARVYLDPCGSLSAVYCRRLEIVASTPTLVPREGGTSDRDEYVGMLNIPFGSGMYPVGLTPRNRIWRLLPNHYLDLRRWESARHWPRPGHVFEGETDRLLDRIVSRVALQMDGLTRPGRAMFGLTAGRDSRMVLACARRVAHRLTIYTAACEYPDERSWLDASTARMVARDQGLDYVHIPFTRPTSEDLEQWVFRTGGSVGEYRGWRWCTTYRRVPPARIHILASGSDLMRGFRRQPGDYRGEELKPARLLGICGLSDHPFLRGLVRDWMDRLPTTEPLRAIDFFYLEQRLGCWGGVLPYAYGDNRTPHIYPFNHRESIAAMLALPCEQRCNDVFHRAIITKCWPELLRYAFNQPRGLQWLARTGYRLRGQPRAIAGRVTRTVRHPVDAVRRLSSRARRHAEAWGQLTSGPRVNRT